MGNDSPKTDTASQAAIINQEIDISIQTIHQNKKILVNFITFYLTAVFGFFYYGAYIESKLNLPEIRKSLPNSDYIVLGLIGVFINLIIFLFGWALLGLVTRTICTTIKQYKHISYMRNLSASFFEPGKFKDSCLNPIAIANPENTKLPIRVADSLPYLFALVNFMFLFSSLYFLKLFLTTSEAISIFIFTSGLFAVFYPNIFSKHFIELKIVQEINPIQNHLQVFEKYMRLKKRTKKLRRYKFSFLLLLFLSIAFFLSFIFNFIQDINQSDIDSDLILTQGIVAILMGIISLFVSFIKVEKKISFHI